MIQNTCLPKIHTMPLIQALPADAQAAVLAEAECRPIPKHHFIFQTGEPATHFYLICKGQAKITNLTPDGKEQILYVYREGDFIGGLNLLMSEAYLYNGEALEDMHVLAIPAHAFHRYMVDNPQALRVLLEQSFERIRWAESLIDRLSQNTADLKTAALLLRLIRDIGTPCGNGFRLHLTMNREDLGAYAGLTRESITRTLNAFRHQGLVAWSDPQTLTIPDPAALQDLLN